MHFDALSEPELRVLGCLIEKRFTTPDQYPLSLNALRLACNQATNRDPVTEYDEGTVREAAQRLSRYGLARLASGHNSRAIKYRHLAEEALGLGRPELAVLCVLILRGPQTPGELKGRSERMSRLGSLDEVEQVLAALGERDYVRRLDRRPGQKEDRFEHQLGGTPSRPAAATANRAPVVGGTNPAPMAHEGNPMAHEGNPVAHEANPVAHEANPALVTTATAVPAFGGGLAARVAKLEGEVTQLRAELKLLRDGAGVSGRQ